MRHNRVVEVGKKKIAGEVVRWMSMIFMYPHGNQVVQPDVDRKRHSRPTSIPEFCHRSGEMMKNVDLNQRLAAYLNNKQLHRPIIDNWPTMVKPFFAFNRDVDDSRHLGDRVGQWTIPMARKRNR